ncbi:outer membrane protein assembly factor BamA [Rubellimicrobium sp. CFH 75288]|uniref:outer membrane protein assembly factor BamA n=1 Tax=Rubellimicrobium sp. CFH 75288 TaxID=2697034 RepID=UPI0014121D11|nr:outer membrane protein assembly factor BamA [Rubellimicrobium sp. CFH 75288]NAZ36968.1 outer membrane protein assembly factor BamA [Rubellimicrobium sp. CFH 75288]
MRGQQGGAARRALRGSVLAAAILVAAAPLGAQTYSFGTVRVEGNQLIETGTILSRLGIGRGETVTAGRLNDAAQALRASGLFETVEVIPQGSTLVVRVREWPTINRIAFEGNSVIRDEQLAAVVGSIERRVYSPTQAERDTAAIAEAYAAAGRVNAVVVPAIIRRPDNRVDLVFQIAEGGITEVERISFVGNRSFSDRRLRSVLQTRQAGLLRAIIRADTFVAERIEFDRQALVDFYRSRGFADARVTDVDVNLTRERDAYLITFSVEEGQRFQFGDVQVTSAIPEANPETFRQVVRVQPGQIYSPATIDADIARIEALALRQGIPFLRVEPRITRDPRGLLLNIEYALVPGERIFVERIDIEGNATTLDRVIRSQFRTAEGDPFNPREIRESAERIRALGYFSDAEVTARQGSNPDQVVIDVNVTEQPTGSLSFGANYSTDTGVSLVAQFAEENFLGRGQRLNFNLQWGQDNQLLTFRFAEPQFLNRDLVGALDFSYRTTQRAGTLYDTDTFRFSPSLTFPVSENGRLQTFYALEFTDITNVAEGTTDPDTGEVRGRASQLIFDEAAEGGEWTNALGYTYTWDSRRTNIDTPTNFTFRLGQEFGVGEDSTFIRSTGLASAETRVFGEDITLRASLEGGYLHYIDGASRVTDRFFLGSRTFRGFRRQGIGPRDAETDDALGGNAFAVLRLETEFPLGLPQEYGISGGAFVDYGSVWDVGDLRSLEPDDVLYNDFTPRAIAGVSLFWTTPIGPLRFNFTRPLMVEEQDRPQNFDITVSTRF